MKKNHWKEYDNRAISLNVIINSLEKLIIELKKKEDEVYWYDGIWLLEETEPIIGITFITLQNYINSSIYDKFNNLEKQYLKYKIGEEFNNSRRTKIELIIAVANYFKHRDHPKELRGETSKILTDFNIQFDKNVDIINSPIFKAIGLLSKNWEVNDLIEIVVNWRNKLWEIDDCNYEVQKH